jgi:hypothetical protein
MRVFVGGSSQDTGRVLAAIRMVREDGHEITHDWTPAVKKIGRSGPGVLEEYREEKKAIADSDLYVLVEHPLCVTALVEVGFALGKGIHVMSVYHEEFKRPIWYEDGLVKRVSGLGAMRGALHLLDRTGRW